MKGSWKGFKEKALVDPEDAREYERFSAAYELRKQLVRIRKEAGLTQEEIAEILQTKKSSISRLENVDSKVSPKLSTIEAYAKAAGYKLEVNFIPQVR